MKPSWMRKLAKSLFGSTKKNRSRPAFSRSIEIEQLENRLTPTTITNVGGLILILGSNGPLLPDDNLTISIANNQLTVTEANSTLTGTVFGIAAANNTVTIDFATNAAAKALTGIQINLLSGDDTLNIVTGLDFRSLPINNNAVSILFDGDGLGSPAGKNIFTFQGLTASKTSFVSLNNFTALKNTDAAGNLATIQANTGILSLSNNAAMTLSATAAGSVAFEASTSGNTIAINNQLIVNTPLFVRGVAAADNIGITASTTTGISFNGNGAGSLSFRTQGDINIQGSVTLKNSFTVLDSENFTAQADVTATSISMTSNTNSNATKVAFNRNVTTSGDFLITNLGNSKTSGAQFFINRDAITLDTPGLTFNVGGIGGFTAATTGGLYDLIIAGQTATIAFDITIANQGSLTLGTVNIPTNPPNGSITSTNGSFDASALFGPTNLFMDIISAFDLTINGNITVQSANAGTINRNFLVQSELGDINISGQIQLQDNAGNTSLGSDLTLLAGINIFGLDLDFGVINLQSVIGVNRSLTIIDCEDFTATGSIQVKSLVLQSTGGDANLGAGQYVFNGNVGLLSNPTAITANSGGYGIQILGSANVFGSTAPAALSDFNNTGTVVLGKSSSATINFTGGAIFHENTTVSGIGVISGITRIQGNLAPGGVTTNGAGVLTFTSALTLEETNPLLAPDLRKSVYYPEILGNIPGSTQDQVVAQSGFILNNNPILYPILRSSTLAIGSQFTIVRETDASPIAGKFTGLVNLASNTYAVLNEGDTFFASGGQFRISYTGGDGNDVVIAFLGYASGTSVFVDANNVLNILGDNKASNVTTQIIGGVLNIQDKVFGLTGFAYGSKVINNNIDIAISSPTAIGPNQFTGLQVQQNGGSDSFNLINVDLVAINAVNPNVANVSFSFNGGPTATPNQDIDILNITGLNQNVETGASGTSTVLIQGYDFIRSQNGLSASSGVLNSANQGSSSLKVLGGIYYDIGDITFGSNNRENSTFSTTQVPSTTGTITLANNAYLLDGVKLTLGNGSASNLVMQSITGTQGGVPSDLAFNVARFNSVLNGNNTPSIINLVGGNITVNGPIGTDISNFDIIDSGITVFNQSVDAASINILKNDGGINFKSTVGGFSSPGLEPIITIGAISQGAFISFQDNLTATSINSTGANLNYGLQFLGSFTTVTNNTNLLNTGGIVLGDSIDTLSFLGGLDIAANSPVQISGIIQSQGALINIASNTIINGNIEIGITLNANTIIKTTFGPLGTSGPISLGRIFSNANSLSLDAGNNTGSIISIDQLRGDGGSLTIINSAGVTISQVGKLSTVSGSSTETFGTISILDSINDIVFDGPILTNKILTFEKNYNVSFIGDSASTYDQRVFIITDLNPTVFRNRGDVTFGFNGSDPNTSMDFFIFNGGVDTSPITGTTNLAARIYTNNSDIIFDDILINNNTFLNTYLSSVAISDFLDLGFPSTIFGNPPIDLTSNILNIFGYPNSSRFSLNAGNEVLPFSTGSIALSSVVNNGFTFSLNAGGPGAVSSIVAGNISMASYSGNFNDVLSVYRAYDVTVFGALSGYDMFFGTIANGSSSLLVELTGTVSVQGNLTVTNNFQVSTDVNNFAITGDVNTFFGQNNINNIGFLQLGNSSTDLLTSSTNLNVRGPAERRIAGLFNLTGSRTLDFGPGITSLVANTVVNTNSQVGTTIGQINNNAFSLTINGKTQIQRYANDSQLSPYPSPTNPTSIIPINNILGAGTGGGNVVLNGEVSIQSIVQSALSAILVTDGGSGYTSPPTVVIQGGGGSGGNGVSLLGVTGIEFIIPGTGFVVGDAVTLSDRFSSNTTASAVVSVVSPTGGILNLTITNPGTGYFNRTSILDVTGGTGTGARVFATGSVVSVSITNQGSGYSAPPIVSFSSGSGTVASGIANITVSNGFPVGNIINLPNDISLRKQGTGSVILNTDSSANTAGLVTTIENGNFFFENAKINAATVTNVAGNGLLGGTKGTLGAVNVLPRGQLSPGNLTNSIGVLNLQGNLSVQSTYKVDIRSVAFNLFDQVNVTGEVSLAKNNVNGILDVAFTPDASVTIGNAFGIISNDGTDLVTGNFVTVGGRALTQNSTFTVNMPNGTDVATFQISYTGNIAANGTASLTGGNDVVIQITNIQTISSTLAAKSQNPNKLFAVSTDSGGGPIVKISFADGSGFSFFAYDTSFTGGVRTAIGDVNGDGTPDLITAAGPGGGPHVVIWTITPGVPYATVQSGFFAFEPDFTGGITLATGNINGDSSSSGNSLDDIIVGAGAGGGPRVKAFAGNASFAAINNQSQLVDFFAYAPEFNLGVNVAAGDRTSDGNDEIITGAAQGGGPHVQVWQISNGTANSIQSFFAFDPTFLCGVFVGSGDLDGDGLADIYTGTGSGPIGSVGIYFGNGAVSRLEPFGSGFTGGVRVGAALGALNSNTNTYPPYLLTAAGPGGGPQVSLFDSNLNIVDAFFAFQENFTGGVLASTTVNT
jgi:hypothetical protein